MFGIDVFMKRVALFFAVLLFCLPTYAGGIPKYPWCKDWIEKHCATNMPSTNECVFIGHDVSPQYAAKIPFHQGITLREIINQTPYSKGTANIWIMHQHPKEKETAGEFITVKPKDNPEFQVRESDVLWVWIYKPDA
jgi:hypothetical protein